ncbi:hypothetical protein [Achromobacter xylosoxidans]|uniref:hypothetical protein n=1 Tax=Alcaligenes xylosoxydans xylosoxydans TaxID=85698 RepID=UPI0013AF03D2|nr:hypothetical protein [Achromobacter xylosoxidans]
MSAASTRIVDVKPQNRIKTIERLADGGLAVKSHTGERGIISKDDPEVQAFAVYSVLAEL